MSGLIARSRLGGGATFAGTRYLADDQTWKIIDLSTKADLVSTKVPTAQLGTGATGAGTYYLADDQTYKPLSGMAIPTATTAALATKLPVPTWASGRYYESQFHGPTYATGSVVAGTVYYELVYVPNSITVTELLAVTAGTGTSSTVILGLYASNSAGTAPTTLLYTGSAVSTVAAGNKSQASVNTALSPGFYWTACLPLGTTMPQFNCSSGVSPLMALGAPTAGTDPINGGATQTGQASLPATATPVLATTNGARPRVQIRPA